MADQAGEAHRRDQERTLRPRGLEVERCRAERTAWPALGAEVEALLGRAQGRMGRNPSARHGSGKGTRVGVWQRFATKWAIVFTDSSHHLSRMRSPST